MARQERGERTRRALLRAAAGEFARHGFAGTSLIRISRAADVTMGALTFHFAAKSDLAQEVEDWGILMTRQALPPRRRVAGVEDVTGFARTLVRLLEREVAVRAAARLAWDWNGTGANWYETWLALLHDRLGHVDDGLAALGPPQRVAALVLCAVAGTEVAVRLGAPGGPGGADPAVPVRAPMSWPPASHAPPEGR
ncbi:TetR family transcriptional regulator [Streptomyces thermogriseus]|uniref:HTH tetR-type domain-containing protein n=1 Tax=Streptomyces thermogriseus TaxID=75292 RepID=A0ABN1T495_9ACTN